MPRNNTQFNLSIKVNGKEVKNTLNSVGKELSALRSRTRNLTEGTEEWEKANLELAKTERIYDQMKKNQRELLDETKKTIDVQEDQTAAMSEFGNSVIEAWRALASGDLAGFRAAWSGITAGIKSATRAALAFIATPIGATITLLVGLGAGAKKLFDYNKELHKLNEELRALGVSALEMVEVRSEVQATAKTFDKEFSEIAKKAKGLSETFKISMAEANDIIARGLADGGKMNSEFLDSLGEYDTFFADAGYSAQSFVDIINQGYELGIYTDKLPDAIKEASLSLREQTTATRDALINAFGASFTEELLEKIDAGQITVSEGLREIAIQSEKTGLTQQQQAQLTADVFRGAGEDAGGAMKVLEAISKSAQRELSAVAKSELEVLEANKRLNEAQAELFEIGGLEEVWNKVKSAALSALADILHGFTRIFASVEDLKRVAQTEGQQQAVKDMIANAKEFGTSVAEEAEIQMTATAKNIQRIKKEIENLKWYQSASGLKEHLAEQEAYFEELKRIASGASEEMNKTQEDSTSPGRDEVVQKAAEEKNAKEKKLRAQAITDFIIAERRRRELAQMSANERELALIDDKYAKMIEKAAGNEELIQQLEAERQKSRDEVIAKQNEEKLKRLEEFENRKQELLDEIELQKAETDEEKEELKKEQELEKEEEAYEKKLEDFEEEMEFLQMTEEEKNSFLELMEESHLERMQGIRDKYAEIQKSKNKKFYDELIQAEENLQRAKGNALASGINLLQGFFDQSSGIYKMLFALEKGLAIGEVVTSAAKGIAQAQANHAAVPPVIGAAPNPMYAVSLATMTKNILATKISAAAQIATITASAIQGFFDGGYTDMFGMGVRDQSGHEIAGIVHKNEYVVPEIVRKDPEVPYILDYLESKRKKKLGLYADGGDTITESRSPSSDPSATGAMFPPEMVAAMNNFVNRLNAGLEAKIFFGPEAEIKRQEQEKKIKKIQNAAQVKKN